jgi:streptogramin lyase
MLRALPNGSVYVNDNQRRQMLLLDPTLKDIRVIADTAPGAPLPYGQRPAGLLAYVADSTIIVDPSTSALLVLNGQGKVSRIMASPRTNDINTLASANLGSNAFDSSGQLVYRV